MTVQPSSHNPIEQRKVQVRRYSRRALQSAVGGVAVGAALALLTSTIVWLLVGVVVGGAATFHYWRKIQAIVNYRD